MMMNQERRIQEWLNIMPLLYSWAFKFDDADKYDFSKKAFIEFIKSPDCVHLYFDINWLTTLKLRIKSFMKGLFLEMNGVKFLR